LAACGREKNHKHWGAGCARPPIFINLFNLQLLSSPLKIDIIYDSPSLFGIDKPGGLVVERDPHGYPSVEEWALGFLPWAGIVHRLDRAVSGVLLLAKKKSSLRELNRQFAEREVEKTYLARVERAPDTPQGLLEHWLGKDQKNKRGLVLPAGAPGAFACQLEYATLETYSNGEALLEVRPHAGKFHQIRVQLSAIGCPIVGDEKYGSTRAFSPNCIALHAWRLRFRDPGTGEPISLAAAPPFSQVIG